MRLKKIESLYLIKSNRSRYIGTYKSYNAFFDFQHEISTKSRRTGKNLFQYSYSAGKKAIRTMRSSSWDLKKVSNMQASVIGMVATTLTEMVEISLFSNHNQVLINMTKS